jgi:O-antigen/teichoic acid export membrane protein
MKKIKINLIVSVIYQIFAIIYGFVLPRLILEQFGSEANGLVQSITQFLGIIGFLDMGVGQVVRSALYRPIEEKDNGQISRVLVSGNRFYRRIAYLLLGYVVILVMVYPCFVDQGFDQLYVGSMIVIMSIGIFAQYYFGVIQEQLLHASQKSYLVYIVQTFCYLFNMAVCVFMIRMNCSIHAVKLVTATVFLVKPIFCSWYIHRRYNIDWRVSYKEEPIKQKWNGVAQHVSAVVLEGTDNIVLTLFSTLSNVSIYSVYYMIVTNLHGFYQIAITGIQSLAGAVWAKSDQQQIRRLFYELQTCLHATAVFLFSCTGILIVPFVQVYTAGLSDADYFQPVFAAVLVLAYGVRCLRTPYNIWIMAAGHFKQTQKCHIIAAVMNLLISIFAVSYWGLVGIAIGTLIAMCYQTTWMTIYTTKNLVKCSFAHILKQWMSDITAMILICLISGRIVLQDVSYLGWFIMAIKVALIAVMSITVVQCLFFPRKMREFLARFMRKLSLK